MDAFPVTRITILEDGKSAFVDDSLTLESAGRIGLLSTPIETSSLILRANPPDYEYEWHRAPRRQFVLMLTGEAEITVATGETRRFNPGDVIFLEDTDGTGHKTSNVGGTWRLTAFVATTAEVPFTGPV